MQLNLIRYLAGKDDDILDDPGSLVLHELLSDKFSDSTGPNDCEVCVSRHEQTVVFTVRVIWDPIRVSSPSIYPLYEPWGVYT